MVVDTSGRAYVGNYGYDLMAGDPPAAATLIRVDPDGTVSPPPTACTSRTAR